MRAIPLICSFLTLHSVSSSDADADADADAEPNLPSEMLDAIVRQVVVSQEFNFCGYVDWLAGDRWAWPWTDVGMSMLKEIAKEQEKLDFYRERERYRNQQIFTNVRTFVRIHSRLPIDCTGIEADTLRDLAGVFESTYEQCAPLSESSTWKKACMAGLFGLNTLIKLLPYLSRDFCSNNKDILLQTAFFIGDIDSVDAIIGFFSLSKDKVLENLPELDIVVSGSVNFFDELLKRLPNLVITKKLGLIREASLLNRLGVLTSILNVAKPAEPHELNQILDSFNKLKMFKEGPFIFDHSRGELGYVLIVAAQHGDLSIIRFLWLVMDAMPNDAVVKGMMAGAGKNNHRSVIEFLLWESGGYYMNVAQNYVNDAFAPALLRGHFEIIKLLTREHNDGTFVFPGLRMITPTKKTLSCATAAEMKWEGIEYLISLKEKGDSRFADFELVDQDNTALCAACEAGNYDVIKYLLRKTDDGEFVFPRTNPAAQNNMPLINACLSGNLLIVQMFTERDLSGKYIYEGIDPFAQDYWGFVDGACACGHIDIVKFFLKMEGGRYVLSEMENVNFTEALISAILGNHIKIVELLLTTDDGKYVFPGMEGVDFTKVLDPAVVWYRMEIVELILKTEDGKCVLPGIKTADITQTLFTIIAWGRVRFMRFLLSRADGGSYLLPGVKVTEAMSMTPNISPEMRELLQMNLEQQRIDEQKHGI